MNDPINLSAPDQLCADVVAFLSGQGVNNGVAILRKYQGDAITKINEAFNSAGIFGEVWVALARAKRAQTKRVIYETVDFVVDFYENVELNQTTGTRKGAWFLAEQAFKALNFEVLPGYGSVITAAEGGPTLEDVSKNPDSGDLTVRLRLTTRLDLPPVAN